MNKLGKFLHEKPKSRIKASSSISFVQWKLLNQLAAVTFKLYGEKYKAHYSELNKNEPFSSTRT